LPVFDLKEVELPTIGFPAEVGFVLGVDLV
jgi:hypothetical protein